MTTKTIAIATATLACAVWFAAPAQAQTWIDAWDYDFLANPYEDLSGNDGWLGGWDEDPWTSGGLFEGEASPWTDEGGGPWSQSSATRNTMVQSEAGAWANAALEAQLAIYDNDTLGLVIRQSDPGTFYLFFMTRQMAPSTGEGGDGEQTSGAYIYRVEDGFAELAARNTEAEYDIDQGEVDYRRMRVEAIDDTIIGYYSSDDAGSWSDNDVVVEFSDPDPLGGGLFGFYTFQMGEANASVGFRAPALQAYDADEDAHPDDSDCDPADGDVHPDADEVCDDGVDNDCDGDIDDVDTDCGGSGDDDDDDDDASDDDDDDDVSDDDDDDASDDDDDDDGAFTLVDGGSNCACEAARGGPAGPLAALALIAAALLRRARR